VWVGGGGRAETRSGPMSPRWTVVPQRSGMEYLTSGGGHLWCRRGGRWRPISACNGNARHRATCDRRTVGRSLIVSRRRQDWVCDQASDTCTCSLSICPSDAPNCYLPKGGDVLAVVCLSVSGIISEVVDKTFRRGEMRLAFDGDSDYIADWGHF